MVEGIKSVEDYEENYTWTVVVGSKSFVEIEGWTLKPGNTCEWQRNNLVYHDWIEAPKGTNLDGNTVTAKWNEFKNLTKNNPDRFWTFIWSRLK